MWTEPQKLDTNFWDFFMTKYNEQFKLAVVRQYLDGRQAELHDLRQLEEEGFGGTNSCSFCNWRNSPLLPYGGQSA